MAKDRIGLGSREGSQWLMTEVIAKHPRAKFFGQLAEFTQAFLNIETQGFDLLT